MKVVVFWVLTPPTLWSNMLPTNSGLKDSSIQNPEDHNRNNTWYQSLHSLILLHWLVLLHRVIGSQNIFIVGDVASVHITRTCGRMEVQQRSFLTWAVDGLQRSACGSDRSTSGQRVPVNIQRVAGWGAEAVWPLGEEKNLVSLPQIKP